MDPRNTTKHGMLCQDSKGIGESDKGTKCSVACAKGLNGYMDLGNIVTGTLKP